MHIHSIQASRVRTIIHNGRSVQTGIFKESVGSRAFADKKGISGDEQADLKHHGSEYMAVYTYALEHYKYWKSLLARADLSPGMFGENITTVGLEEDDVNIGDTYRFGAAVLEAVQPRYPCRKLGIRMEDDQIIPKFIKSKRTGIYWRVLTPGALNVNDVIENLAKNPKKIKVNEIFAMMNTKKPERANIERLLSADVIDPRWETKLREKFVDI